jgi:hypothetical protein
VRLTIESTGQIYLLDGRPVRLWIGTTPSGRKVDLYVASIGSDDPAAQHELGVELALDRDRQAIGIIVLEGPG